MLHPLIRTLVKVAVASLIVGTVLAHFGITAEMLMKESGLSLRADRGIGAPRRRLGGAQPAARLDDHPAGVVRGLSVPAARPQQPRIDERVRPAHVRNPHTAKPCSGARRYARGCWRFAAPRLWSRDDKAAQSRTREDRKMFARTALLALTAMGLVSATSPSWRRTNSPSRTIRIVVPFAAGGGVDTLARLMAERMQAKMGVNVIVENRAGASGTIGGSSVMQSAAGRLHRAVLVQHPFDDQAGDGQAALRSADRLHLDRARRRGAAARP